MQEREKDSVKRSLRLWPGEVIIDPPVPVVPVPVVTMQLAELVMMQEREENGVKRAVKRMS